MLHFPSLLRPAVVWAACSICPLAHSAGRGFHHWVVYNIPAAVRTLEGNASFEEGTTSMNTHAYFGPCPPPTGQPHHYIFTLYALKVDHVQEQGLTYDGLLQAMQGQVLAAASLVGLFQRVPE